MVLVVALAAWSIRAVARWVVSVPEPAPAAPPSAELVNPLPPDAQTIALGRRLYMQNCAFCHGPGGRGDGRAAPGLLPPPEDLTSVGARRLTDGELYTLIGAGVPKTAMPAWEKVLDPGQRWALVAFIRAELQR
jgi:copper transport protein